MHELIVRRCCDQISPKHEGGRIRPTGVMELPKCKRRQCPNMSCQNYFCDILLLWQVIWKHSSSGSSCAQVNGVIACMVGHYGSCKFVNSSWVSWEISMLLLLKVQSCAVWYAMASLLSCYTSWMFVEHIWLSLFAGLKCSAEILLGCLFVWLGSNTFLTAARRRRKVLVVRIGPQSFENLC